MMMPNQMAHVPAPQAVLARDRTDPPDWLRDAPILTDKIAARFLESRVVFYPGSGTDGQATEIFNQAGAAFCFVHADLNVRHYGDAPLGYASCCAQHIDHNQLAAMFRLNAGPFAAHNGPLQPSALWTIFKRASGFDDQLGAEFFALLHIFGEAFDVYWNLWARHGKAPYAVLIQDGLGHNFIGHPFGGANSPMYEWAEQAREYPRWLLVADNTEAWPGYDLVSGGIPGGMHGHLRRLYRRRD